MTRQRTSQFPPRDDPESTISRSFTLPSDPHLHPDGERQPVRPDPRRRDRPAGRPRARPRRRRVRRRLLVGPAPRRPQATASATLDGEPHHGLAAGPGHRLRSSARPSPTTCRHPSRSTTSPCRSIADGRHSVPTSHDDHGQNAPSTTGRRLPVRTITLPPIADSTVPGAVTNGPGELPRPHRLPVRRHLHRRPRRVRRQLLLRRPARAPARHRRDRHPRRAEPRPPRRSCRATACRTCLSIDGQPIDVALVGSTQSALNGGQVQVVPCGPDAHGITLGPGTHVVQTATGHTAELRPHAVDLHRMEPRPAGPRFRRRRRSRRRLHPDGCRDAPTARHAARPGACRHGRRRATSTRRRPPSPAPPSPSSSCSERASTRAGRRRPARAAGAARVPTRSTWAPPSWSTASPTAGRSPPGTWPRWGARTSP